MQAVLDANNFGHGTIYKNGAINFDTRAFSGNRNPDNTLVPGVPLSAAFTVKDASAFFNEFWLAI
jgi:hypothetical protein